MKICSTISNSDQKILWNITVFQNSFWWRECGMFCRIFSVLRDTFEFSWILPDVILFSSQSIVNLIYLCNIISAWNLAFHFKRNGRNFRIFFGNFMNIKKQTFQITCITGSIIKNYQFFDISLIKYSKPSSDILFVNKSLFAWGKKTIYIIFNIIGTNLYIYI